MKSAFPCQSSLLTFIYICSINLQISEYELNMKKIIKQNKEVSGIPNKQKMNFIHSNKFVSSVCILVYQNTQGKEEYPPDNFQESDSGTRILSTAPTSFGFDAVKQFHFSHKLFVH